MKTAIHLARTMLLAVLLYPLALTHIWFRRTWCFYDVPDELKNMLAGATAEVREFVGKQTKAHDELANQMREAKARILDVEQRLAHKLGGNVGSGGDGSGGISEMTDLIVKSDQLAAYVKGSAPSVQITIPRAMFSKAMITNTPGIGAPLVAPDYRPGIAFAPQRRLTIRDLFNAVTTQSSLITFARELAYTNSAGPQWDPSSPTPGQEGALKNESGITFQLAQAPVTTISHWVPASRQILDDSNALQNHLESRLLYGLKLEEENELLNGDGTVGKLNGLVNNATAFSGGATNQSPLDSLALALAQLAASEYEPGGYIINPSDWYSDKIILKKNSLGDYIFGDPGEMTTPVLWGLPAVLTNTMTKGKFMCLDAQRAGYIADREDANLRISENYADFFLRNAVVLLMEERVALVIEQGAAMIYGDLSNAG